MDDIQSGRIARLKQFQKSLNLKQIDLAKLLETNPAFISQIMSGRRKVSEAFAYKISSRYSWFNPDWLISGNGAMKKDGSVIDDSQSIVLTAEEEKSSYQSDPLSALRKILEGFDARIAKLEADVSRMRSLLGEGNEGKG